MFSLFTPFSVGAESREIEAAYPPLHMPLRAPRAQWTESPHVVLAHGSSSVRVDVQVIAVVTAAAVSARKVRALGP